MHSSRTIVYLAILLTGISSIGRVIAAEGESEPNAGGTNVEQPIRVELGGDTAIELVPVPAGQFHSGSPENESGRRPNEFLPRNVMFERPFWVGKYEVTSMQYGVFRGLLRYFPNLAREPDRPMASVSWLDANEFCRRLNEKETDAGRVPVGYEYRLPTELEWEYACRAGRDAPFGVGNGVHLSSQEANFNGEFPFGRVLQATSHDRSINVGSYLPNAWGIFDMHGNLWEWCLDRYRNPRFDSGVGHSIDIDEPKTLRGGSWTSSGRYCRAATRLGSSASIRRSNTGFRIVLAPALDPPTTISQDTTWTLDVSPYVVSKPLIVAPGVTLTIDPGVDVHFAKGRGMRVAGRLVAEGTESQPISFTSGTSGAEWGQLVFTSSPSTSVLRHVVMSHFGETAIEGRGTSLHLDHITWTNSSESVLDLHSSSIELLNSRVPGGAGSEPIHFTEMPPEGRALIRGCVFEAPQGYCDSIDFTGGNRPGPIVEFIDNVFLGAVDDCFDMDGTDAHIEGNIFLNVLQDLPRDSSSNPIAAGEGDETSELVICRNIFYNCEHVLLLKDSGTALVQNNTIVNLVTNEVAVTDSGQAIPPGIILFGEPWRGRPLGGGAIFQGNIVYGLAGPILKNPFPHFDPKESFLEISRSLIQGSDAGRNGNLNCDPLFANLTERMTHQNIKNNLRLSEQSPCRGTGPNGLDMGALVPPGASISGEPVGETSQDSALLNVGGPGIYAYRWRLNNGPWSPEISLTNNFKITPELFQEAEPISLQNLKDGSYTVSVIGKNSAGRWQSMTKPTVSKTWTVKTKPE